MPFGVDTSLPSYGLGFHHAQYLQCRSELPQETQSKLATPTTKKRSRSVTSAETASPVAMLPFHYFSSPLKESALSKFGLDFRLGTQSNNIKKDDGDGSGSIDVDDDGSSSDKITDASDQNPDGHCSDFESEVDFTEDPVVLPSECGKLVLERCPSPPHHGVHPDSQSTVSASDLEALCNEIKLVTERPFDGAVPPSTPRWGTSPQRRSPSSGSSFTRLPLTSRPLSAHWSCDIEIPWFD